MKKPKDAGGINAIIAALRADIERLGTEAAALPASSRQRRQLDSDLRDLAARVEALLRHLDPIQHPAAVFDPSNPKIIGRFIALALVAQPRQQLSSVGRFYGSGVYAIYYRGPFTSYAQISGAETPIYVGQASPAVPNARTAMEQSDRLARRLDEHRRNIAKATSTLALSDFECRALVVQSGWETAAEDYLIELFQPIWNSETNILYGLGKHGDDAETRANKRSPWDTLHPGREWAAKTTEDARTPTQIAADLTKHFTETHVFKTIDEVLKEFIDELRQL
jgi:hypothetical protein